MPWYRATNSQNVVDVRMVDVDGDNADFDEHYFNETYRFVIIIIPMSCCWEVAVCVHLSSCDKLFDW